MTKCEGNQVLIKKETIIIRATNKVSASLKAGEGLHAATARLRPQHQRSAHTILSLADFFVSLVDSRECWEELDSLVSGMSRRTF